MANALPIPQASDWRHRYSFVDGDGQAQDISTATPRLVLTHQASGAVVELLPAAGLLETAGAANAIDVEVDRVVKQAWPRGMTTVQIQLVWPDTFDEVAAVDLVDVHAAGVSTGAGSSTVIRAPAETRIVRSNAGPPGPAGPVGGEPYVHTQASPSNDWVVNHNLGHRPLVSVLNAGGIEVEATIVHVSVNQLRVQASSAFAGTARCL